MGFEYQSNRWQCGPFALKHALATLGVFVSEHEITELACSTRNGTNEKQLGVAAKKYDCHLDMVRAYTFDVAHDKLLGYLRRDVPVLVCVNEWDHWVTIVREENGRFVIIDSMDEKVLSVWGWRKLRSKLVYHNKDKKMDPQTILYDICPLIPKFYVTHRAKLSVARVRYLRRKKNIQLAQLWDGYVSDLLEITHRRTPLSEHVMTLGTFFNRYGNSIVKQVAFWHGDVPESKAKQILKNFRFVADTHGLVIHEKDELNAVVAMTSLLTLWAVKKYGT